MLDYGNAMASQHPLTLGLGYAFVSFSSPHWYGAQCRESDCLASDRLLYPSRCKIPPEDLSLGLLVYTYSIRRSYCGRPKSER